MNILNFFNENFWLVATLISVLTLPITSLINTKFELKAIWKQVIAWGTSIALTVEGCVNIIKPNGDTMTDAECSWTPLAIISMSDFSVLSEIADNGIYAIGINGSARVRVVISSIEGEAVITGVAEA